MLGIGLRRRGQRWLAPAVFTVGTLIGLAGIGACSASFNMTPGTYQYTISAAFQETGANVLQGVNTNVNVTLP
jgi:hypothetical protein